MLLPSWAIVHNNLREGEREIKLFQCVLKQFNLVIKQTILLEQIAPIFEEWNQNTLKEEKVG